MTDTTTADTTAVVDATTTATTATTDSATTTASGTGEVQGDATTTTEATQAAPVEYTDFKLPEGYTLDGERLTALKDFAKANNWTQEQAQAAVDKHIEMSEAGIAAVREAKVTTWTEQSKQQFGANFQAITTDAKAGLAWAMKERPNMLQTFDDEGWGSNPDALWVFAKLGALSRGSQLEGMGGETSGDTPQPKSTAAVMYPNEAK